MKTNKSWHTKNRMPKNATLEQRVKWHFAHAKNCACRPIPDSIKEELKKKAI